MENQPPSDSGQQRYQAIRTVTVVSALVNLALSLLKVTAGWLGNSQALIVDGIHSLSDLTTDALVVYAAKHGSREADEQHPYGHGRIETAYTVALGTILVAVALGIIYDAGSRLIEPSSLLHPGLLALGAAVASILVKEWLYRYTLLVAKRVRSNLLKANAWHHRSDAGSSVVVLVGVAGSMLGLDYLDAVASLVVALMIGKIGWDLGWNAVQELIDTGLAPERIAKIRESIMEVDGVRGLHMLRTRRMGGEALVDVHVQVSRWLSVSEGHQISEYVRRQLVQEIDEVADVTVHIDPEDDQSFLLTRDLPLRREILAHLHERWQGLIEFERIERLDLHYLGGSIHVELMLPLEQIEHRQQARELVNNIRNACSDLPGVGSVQIWFG